MSFRGPALEGKVLPPGHCFLMLPICTSLSHLPVLKDEVEARCDVEVCLETPLRSIQTKHRLSLHGLLLSTLLSTSLLDWRIRFREVESELGAFAQEPTSFVCLTMMLLEDILKIHEKPRCHIHQLCSSVCLTRWIPWSRKGNFTAPLLKQNLTHMLLDKYLLKTVAMSLLSYDLGRGHYLKIWCVFTGYISLPFFPDMKSTL